MASLTDKGVKAAAAGYHMDGAGLILKVKPTGARSWIYRYRVGKKQYWMGLGPYPDVSLAQAREAAQDARRQRRQGVDPLQHKRATAALSEVKPRPFRGVAAEYIAAHKAAWRNAKHAHQWTATLTTYVYPEMGDLDVSAIGLEHVLKVLKPIWTAKPETASRVRGRMESVLDYAGVHGWRTGENPSRWRGFLSEVLPAKGKVTKVEHHAALPWRNASALWSELLPKTAVSALALRFIITTASRSGEARGARWAEIDLAARLWTVPAERMKAAREHRVPLSDQAMAVLKAAEPLAQGEGSLVFPGQAKGKPLSDVAVSKTLQGLRPGLTVHGFRSTFRDWCAEAARCPREVAEAALAHTNRDKVEAAYARTDFLDRRRVLMAEWGEALSLPLTDIAGLISP